VKHVDDAGAVEHYLAVEGGVELVPVVAAREHVDQSPLLAIPLADEKVEV
jgi:hypothetical protein